MSDIKLLIEFREHLNKRISELSTPDSAPATPTTEAQRCVECHHAGKLENGVCRALVLAPSVAGSGMAYCNHRCVFPAAPQPETAASRVVNVKLHGEITQARLREIEASVANGYETEYRKLGWSRLSQIMLRDLHFLLTFFATDSTAPSAPDTAAQQARESWQQGMRDAAKEVCDGCDNEQCYGPARRIEGSTRWWHGDDSVPCEAGGIWHALSMQESGG